MMGHGGKLCAFKTLALDGVAGQLHAPGTLPLDKLPIPSTG